MSEKKTYIFSNFGSKISKFEQKKSEKTKTFKSLEIAGNYPKHLIHTSYSIFYTKNQNDKLFRL